MSQTMKYTPLLLLLLGCSQNTVNPGKNPSPEATITSHQDGDQVFADALIELRASVSDANNPANELQAEWRIDDQVICPFGRHVGRYLNHVNCLRECSPQSICCSTFGVCVWLSLLIIEVSGNRNYRLVYFLSNGLFCYFSHM